MGWVRRHLSVSNQMPLVPLWDVKAMIRKHLTEQ